MPRRKSNALPILLGALAVFLVIALVLSMVPRIPLSTGGWFGGHGLTEEVQPRQVLYASTIDLSQGSVWQVSYDINGIHVEQRSSQLIERLNLSGVDISVNDVVAPILYAWLFDGVDDRIVFDEPDITFTTGTWYVEVMDRMAREGYSPNGVGDTGGGWWFQYIFRYNDWDSLSLTEEHSYGNPSSTAFSIARAGNGTVVVALGGIDGFSSGNGYWNREWVVHRITAIYNGTHVDLAETAVMADGTSISAEKVGEVNTSSGVTLTTIRLGEAAPAGYRKPAIELAYAYVEYNGAPRALLSASFYNGTHYIDLVTGTASTIYGNPARIALEKPFLWLVKGLASDNRLHLRFVPPGSIFRIKYGGMVYEWRIDGEPNAAGLIEDYPIDIAGIFGQTVLPNATVELVYPSPKVRFYIPSGFQVVVEGNGWSETHEVPLNSSYVDFSLPSSGAYTVKILGYEGEARVRVETSGDVVRFVVTDSNGYALSGAKIYVYDGGNLAAVGTINDLGYYEVEKSRLSGDQVRVVVVHLKDGTLYHADKLVSLTATYSIPEQTMTPIEQVARAAGSNGSSTAFILVFLMILAMVVVALAKRKR